MNHSVAYLIIQQHYGDKTAHRSGVRLMNHIDEGLAILDAINASQRTKDAFCIHPIVQNDIDIPPICDLDCYDLAVEYRMRANSYLCRPETDWIKTTDDLFDVVGIMSLGCAKMLYADKIQNRKDFRLYHKGTHPRSKQLEAYFELWIEFLNILLNAYEEKRK